MSLPNSTARSGFIAGPIFDTVCFIAAPLLAVLVAIPFLVVPSLNSRLFIGVNVVSLREIFIHAVIYSHLFIVFFRSHVNGGIFRLFPYRFVVVPIALFGVMYWSDAAMVFVGVLAVWWDVYHSSMQTFGLGRIYDMKKGNDLQVGRRLDQVLNLVMYAGPILAGASLFTHLDYTRRADVGNQYLPPLFQQVPFEASDARPFLMAAVLGFSLPFIAYYFYAYWRYHQQGYMVSWQKVSLYAILAVVSLACWGFDSFHEAFFVMNFFHAFQYFAIVWHQEGDHVTEVFRLKTVPRGKEVALALFVLIGISYGVWSGLHAQFRASICVLLVVSIMHFWYDGFIWSVRKGQVR
jgi:hypothetical protein